jgi:hypothetical protein
MAFPQYFFVIRWAGEVYDDPFGTSFPSAADARDYAHRVIRELKAAGDFDEPDLKMIIVKNELGKTVFTIPFAEALN